MQATKKTMSRRKKIILMTSIIIVVAVLVPFLAIKRVNTTNTADIPKNNTLKAQNDDSKAKTTSKAPTAQDDFSDGGSDRDPGNTINEDHGSGIVKDNDGNVTTKTNKSQWTTSKSGQITVYSPVSSQNMVSGAEISGSSSLPRVSFRIIDSLTGMIATGKIDVVDGKFSGTAVFNTSAKHGRLDIFGAKKDGTEFSNISIDIKFNQ